MFLPCFTCFIFENCLLVLAVADLDTWDGNCGVFSTPPLAMSQAPEGLASTTQPGGCTESWPWIKAVQADSGRLLLLGASPQNYWKGFGVGTLHITCELFYSKHSVSRASALIRGCFWLLPRRMLGGTQAALVPGACPEGGERHEQGRQWCGISVRGGKKWLSGLEGLRTAGLMAGDPSVTKTSLVQFIKTVKSPGPFCLSQSWRSCDQCQHLSCRPGTLC